MSGAIIIDGISAERGLWAAVLRRALDDATGEFVPGSPRAKTRIREAARRWILYDEPDFNLVCRFAGLDPGYVRRLIRPMLTGRVTRPSRGLLRTAA